MTELTIQSTTKQKHLLEWSQRVADCRSSGLSVSRWCTEHDIKPKTYYAWQKKVFAAMIEQQKLQMMETTGNETKFIELPSPELGATRGRDLVASVHVGEASLDVYEGASPEIVTALCRVLSHAK
jgi:transposase-like protein